MKLFTDSAYRVISSDPKTLYAIASQTTRKMRWYRLGHRDTLMKVCASWMETFVTEEGRKHFDDAMLGAPCEDFVSSESSRPLTSGPVKAMGAEFTPEFLREFSRSLYRGVREGLRRMEQKADDIIERFYCPVCGNRRTTEEIETFDEYCFYCVRDGDIFCPACGGNGMVDESPTMAARIWQECHTCDGIGSADAAYYDMDLSEAIGLYEYYTRHNVTWARS